MNENSNKNDILNDPRVTVIHAFTPSGEHTATFHIFSTPEGTVILYPDDRTPSGIAGYQLFA